MVAQFVIGRIVRISKLATTPEDSEELVLQKTLMMGGSMMFIPVGLLWGLIYIAFGELRAGLIPVSYSLLSLISLVYFTFTKRFSDYRQIQLQLMLFFPFLLMLVLGGFFNASAVILWSVLSPFGALLFAAPHQAPRLLIAYLLLVALSGILDPVIRYESQLPELLNVVMFVLNVGGVSAIAFILLYYFVAGKDRALQLLRVEQEKSERLLLNVLPKEIAPALREGDGRVAENYDSASILYADIVGFTTLSVEMSAEQMVDLLNTIFSHFDDLVQRYGLEKIRTIGDNYMVAAGVPRRCQDHADQIARLALDMAAYIRSLPPQGNRQIQFRIGINSGSLVAGVIGKHKFQYDIWGDSVNIASRMESEGVPGKIQISPATHALLSDSFRCEPRGKVKIKGKGEMETWFLLGEVAAVHEPVD